MSAGRRCDGRPRSRRRRWSWKSYGADVALTSEWRRCQYLWAVLVPPDWAMGTSSPFDPGEIMQIEFQAPANEAFDFYVDELSFIGGAEN